MGLAGHAWEAHTPAGASARGDGPPPAGGALPRRQRVAMELLASEQRYVAGLRILDRFYYRPMLAHASGSTPIVSRATLNAVFANFVDILQLSTELLLRLEERLGDPGAPLHDDGSLRGCVAEWDAERDVLGDLLLPIAPFLKMYKLFVNNFSSALQSIEEEARRNARFAAFLRQAESSVDVAAARGDEQARVAAGLSLQAQLLAIVQRVPRYRLLLRELVACTPVAHRDYAALHTTYDVVDATARSIDEHLAEHELVLATLDLQRHLVGLREPLVVPGRRLVMHGALYKTCCRNIQLRQVYLFSDCLIYARILGETEHLARSPAWSPRSSMDGEALAVPARDERRHARHGSAHRATSPHRHSGSSWAFPAPPPPSLAEGHQLQFRRKLPLGECTVVACDDPLSPVGTPVSVSMPDLASVAVRPSGSPPLGTAATAGRFRFDLHSPECSCSFFAATREERDRWVAAVRDAQAEHLSAVRSLCPRGEREARAPEQAASPSAPPSAAPTPEPRSPRLAPSRPSLDHYSAPVWVPDSLAVRCVRCNEPFALWRRRHHCRLCGQVVCHACSARQFYIGAPGGRQGSPRLARACDACYDATFAGGAGAGAVGWASPAPAPTPPALLSRLAALPASARRARPVLSKMRHTSPSGAPLGDVTNKEPEAPPEPAPETPHRRPTHRRRWSVAPTPTSMAFSQVTAPRYVDTPAPGRVSQELRSSIAEDRRRLAGSDRVAPDGDPDASIASMPATRATAPPSAPATRPAVRRFLTSTWIQSVLG